MIGTILNSRQELYLRELAAILYIAGSLGFLFVDVIDLRKYKGSYVNRGSIIVSMVGNILYTIGSIAFFPSIFIMGTAVGVWSFIFGSLFIIFSQFWKVYRIGTEEGSAFDFRALFRDIDCATQTWVELNTGLGAIFFSIGTSIYLRGPLTPHMYVEILNMWGIGSTFFVMGSLVLAYRQWILTI